MSIRSSYPALLLAFVMAILGAAPAAAAPTKKVGPAKASGRVMSFVLPARTIKRAHLRAGARRYSVSSRRVRRAQRRDRRVSIRLPRLASPKRTRLVLKLAKRSKRSKRRPTPVVSEPVAPSEPTSPEPGDGTSAPVASPTAPAPSGTTSVTCGLGSFTVGNWPGACWRPYSDSSPWNRRIPADARLTANSSAVVSRLMEFGTPQHLLAGYPSDYQHPTYYSQPSDPEFTLHCYENWGRCAIEGMKVRIPDAARPANGGDAHMTVVDQASGWEYDLYKITDKPAGGGTLTMRWGGRTRIDGDGLGSDATAARFGNLAGVIRAQEMQAGRIDHALFMVVECDSGKYVYPAMKSGHPCSSGQDAPAMGSRFQLDMSAAQIDALAVPAWKKTILRAMAEYGMYVGDTGTGSWGIQFESPATYESFGIEDPIKQFARDNGVPRNGDTWVFNLRDGVDWQKYLRVVDPCVAQASC